MINSYTSIKQIENELIVWKKARARFYKNPQLHIFKAQRRWCLSKLPPSFSNINIYTFFNMRITNIKVEIKTRRNGYSKLLKTINQFRS